MATTYNFSDVFVSYSRSDSAFVRRLTVIIYALSATPEAMWPTGRIPVFFFQDESQRLWLTLMLAAGISLSITTWELFRPLVIAITQRLHKAQA